MKIRNTGLLWAFGLAATGVMLGALGAHALETKLSPDSLDSFNTGVRYQIYHALAIFMVVMWIRQSYRPFIKYAINLFITGTLCFSGSIYLLATREISGISAGFLGPVTPVGGILLIAGWLTLFIGFIQQLRKERK